MDYRSRNAARARRREWWILAAQTAGTTCLIIAAVLGLMYAWDPS